MEPPNQNNKYKYITVRFLKTNEYAAVPASWITDTESAQYCVWPKTKITCRSSLIRLTPTEAWDKHEVEIVEKFESYEEAFKRELRETRSSDSEAERGRGKRKIKRKYPYASPYSEASPPRLHSIRLDSPDIDKESSEGTSDATSRGESVSKYYKVDKQNISKELYDKVIGEFMNPNGPLNALIPNDQVAKEFLSKTSDSVSACSSSRITAIMQPHAVRSQTVMPEPSGDAASTSLLNAQSRDEGNESNDSVGQSDNELSPDVHNSSNTSYVETETNTVSSENSRIIDLLTEIRATTNLILQKLNSEQPALEVIIPTEDKLPALPCKTLDDLLELERLLVTDSAVVSQLETKLLLVGGNNYKHCIYRCLRNLFTNKLAAICSLRGKKNNFALQGLSVVTILYQTLLKSFTVTKMQFDNAVMEWFKHGRQRSLKESQN